MGGAGSMGVNGHSPTLVFADVANYWEGGVDMHLQSWCAYFFFPTILCVVAAVFLSWNYPQSVPKGKAVKVVCSNRKQQAFKLARVTSCSTRLDR